MNFSLTKLPERTAKPRQAGLTMVMDKGLSIREAEDLIETAGIYIDVIKLGFGTAMVTPTLEKKLEIFRQANIPYYFGGTLLEAFIIRKEIDAFAKLLEKFKVPMVEVSDGSITIDHAEKCKLISRFAKDYTVLSEVGSKEEGIIIHPLKWIEMIEAEIKAGSWKVIAEARESGTVGIYKKSGKAHSVLINKILAKIPKDKILWEAPQKSQQAYFIKLLGSNANLGNIAPNEVIALETLRMGLRSDTFFDFLDK